MTSTAKKNPHVRSTLHAAWTLFCHHFGKNIMILIPIFVVMVLTRWVVKGLGHFEFRHLTNGSMTEEFYFSTTEMTTLYAWLTLVTIVGIMTFLDVTRRAMGEKRPKALGTYLGNLFKKMIITAIMVFVAGVFLGVVFAIYMLITRIVAGFVPDVGYSFFWLGVFLAPLFVVWWFGHFLLVYYPLVIDKEKGPFKSLGLACQMAKNHMPYAMRMSVVSLALPAVVWIVLGILAQFVEILTGIRGGPMQVAWLICFLLLVMYMICLQVAIYRQLKS